jgi:hypothetical protein
MIHFDMAEKKLFQFFYCLWSHLFPCPRVQHLELAAHKATLKATPLVLSGKICQGDRSAIDLVRVTKANRFMAKPQDFIDEHVEAGDVEALFIKGLIFYHTHNNQNELKFSEKLIQKAAMGENSDAMLFLATLHMHRAKNSTK